MGVLSFLPIQPGEGEPSPENKRPIYAPLNIDGIGEIWGGEINTNAATITSKWHGINLNGVDYKVNRSYMTDEVIAAGIVYLPRFTSTNGIPALIQKRLDYILASNIECSHRVHNSLPIWTIPGSGRIYVKLWFGLRDRHPEVTTDNECIAFVNNWLKENPVQFVYLLPTEQHVTYNLSTAQLHQALDQLKEYFGGELPLTQMPEVCRRIIMNEPHLVTPAQAKLHTFNTDMIAPLKECKIHFEPVQDGEGDPSPDNVRPITGWTGFTFYRCGKNLTLAKDGATMLTLPYASSSRRDVIRGLPIDMNFTMSCKVSEATGKTTGKRLYLYGLKGSGMFLDTGLLQDGTHGITNKPSVSGSLTISHNITALPNVAGYLYDIQLEIGTTPTEYEEYNGIRQEIDWSTIGEIPGGYINLVKGVLVQTWRVLKINQQAWLYNAKREFFYTRSTDAVGGTIPICSCYPYNYGQDKSVSTTGSGQRVIFDASFNGDVASMLDAVGEQYIGWQTANPVEYPIDPVTLKTLRGINNIWSNANGNIDLAYWTH